MSGQTPERLYFVFHEGMEQGPFTLEMIFSMIAAGIYAAPLQVRESRSEHYQLLETSPKQGEGSPAASKPSGVRRKSNPSKPAVPITAGFLVGCLMIILLLVISRDPEPKADYVSMSRNYSESLVKEAREEPDKRWLTAEEALAKQLANHRKDQEAASSSPSSKTLAPARFLKDAHGQAYHLSDDDFARLSSIKNQLDHDRALLARDEEADEKSRALQKEALELSGNTEVAVEVYRHAIKKIDREAEARIEAFKRRLDDFNTELKRLGKTTPN